jgi:flagellar basal-body rod modification protein FlgD
MAIDSSGGVSGGSLAQGVQLTPTGKNEQLGKSEFLTLLVTQLKNQDPEAPLDSKEFAVQLAQFTQVEKLISIDTKLSAQSDASTMGSLAGYLGRQVVLSGSTVNSKSGDAGQLQLDLSRDADNVKVQFVNSRGAVVGEKSLGKLKAGKQVVSLNDSGLADGTYSVKVLASSKFGGGSFEPGFAPVGLVSGFIPGPSPKLIVGGREITMGEIKEVALAGM